MFLSPTDATSLAQTLQPTLPLFQDLEHYKDLQSVMAVMEAEQSFELNQDTARFKQDGPLEIPDEKERIRFLGYFLSENIDWKRALKIDLNFHSRYAYRPVILMLRSFHLQGKTQVQLKQGLTLHTESQVNLAGLARFEFEPFENWLTNPKRITGFFVYLVAPPRTQAVEPEPVYEEAPAEPGIVRSHQTLNVYRKIDTRV